MWGFIIKIFSFFFIVLEVANAGRFGSWCSCFSKGCDEEPPQKRHHAAVAVAPQPVVIQVAGRTEDKKRAPIIARAFQRIAPAPGGFLADGSDALPPLASLRRHPSSARSIDVGSAGSSVIRTSTYKMVTAPTEEASDKETYRDYVGISAAASALEESPPAITRGKPILRDTILLADDTLVHLKLATRQINSKFSTHALWTADNPDQVRALCQDGFPHLMVLDNSMPEKDAGLNLARWVRSFPEGDKVTIFLWTSDDADYFDAAELARLNITYVPKPQLRVALEGYLVRFTPAA